MCPGCDEEHDGEREGRGLYLVERTAPQELSMDCWYWRRGGSDVVNDEMQKPIEDIAFGCNLLYGMLRVKTYLLLQPRFPNLILALA